MINTSKPTAVSFSAYFAFASSWDVPFSLFQASLITRTQHHSLLHCSDLAYHLALPEKSMMPGRDVVTSPFDALQQYRSARAV